VITFEKGAAQLFLVMLLTLLNMIYFAVIKPYYHVHHRQYNNYLVLHNSAVFILIVAGMIVLEMQNTSLSYDNRVLIGDIIAALVVYSMTANMLYFLFRTYQWYHEHVWRPFVFTELFKENYTLQYWDYKKEYEALDKQKVGKTGNRE
jgi:hypothetical protein